jgi:methionyl-tRNA formyltransferase
MRVVFMGTPEFAVPCLDTLLKEGHQVLGVVTQPDRPKGRGQQLTFSPVKEAALAAGLPVIQPVKVREPQFLAQLQDLAPEVIVVVAFGQLLPGEILDLPPFGCINVHASLLPKYRGAAPLHWSVINGEKVTGITTMYMDRGLDTGDMLLKAELEIRPEDSVGIVHDKLSVIGAELLAETLRGLSEGKLARIQQDHSEFTYAPMLKRQDECIDWSIDGEKVVNLIRGMNPWPGAYTTHKTKIIKVWQAQSVSSQSDYQPGQVIEVDKNKGFIVQTGQGQVMIQEVQPQGGKRMAAAAFARGYGITTGDLLGK